MNAVYILNFSIGLVGLTLSGTMILHLLLGPKMDRRVNNGFLAIFMCLALYTASNLAGQLMRGHPGDGWRTMLIIANFSEFFSSGMLAYIVTGVLTDRLDPERKWKRIRSLLHGLIGAYLVLLVINLFTGLFYYIDENNVYQRSEGYPLSYLIPLILMMIGIGLLVLHGERLDRRERGGLWVYYLVPLAAMGVQMFVYGIHFLNFAVVVAAGTLYTFIVSSQRDLYYKQKQESEQLKVEIMISQIQPHFLYNSLSVIREICLTDAQLAADAIQEFIQYLRHNMESISSANLIPFQEELNHTKRYLQLQQLRFGGELNIAYDIRCSDFRIPSLTLQPLVENAVRYGVRKKEEGEGHVLISTERKEDHIEIRVVDDGPGFDPETITGSNPGHIGIQNVRQRLQQLACGSLEIDSVIGKGTSVAIILTEEEDIC